MEQGILSVKLYELDDKIGRMHSRIQAVERAENNQLKQEMEALERECAATDRSLREKLRFSKASSLSTLLKAYGTIEQAIQEIRQKQKSREESDKNEFSWSEEKILLAEYALDFAIQAANRALLLSMKAIDAQRKQQEERDVL